MVDPFHVPVLHASFSGAQFTTAMAVDAAGDVRDVAARRDRPLDAREMDDGKTFYRVTEAAIPTLRVVPNPRVAQFARVELIGWVLPIDDTSFRIYVAGRAKQPGDLGRMRSKFNGKFWWDMTEEEHQRHPGRLRGAGRPGPDHDPLGGAFRAERPRHRDDPPHAAGPARRARRRAATRSA